MKARRVGNRSHVEHRELIQASRCFLRPIRRLGERRFGLRERGSQCRPNLEPQAIACEADVDVAVIVDERETMTPQICVDALARHVEPRPHPRDTVALDRVRHAGQTRDAFVTAATSVSEGRGQAAKKLDAAVAAELAPLRLDKARFRTVLTPLLEAEWGVM